MFNPQRLIKSFHYAMRGLRQVWQTEQNFRIQTLVSILVIIAMLLFRVPTWQAIILIMLIVFVLVLELMNTITEKIVDILKPRMHMYVQVIKDLMAAAVFVSAFGAAAIGLIIFLPYFVALFRDLVYTIY